MLPDHERDARKIFDEYNSAGKRLAAIVRTAYPIGTLIEVERPKLRISGRVSGYSPTNPREVWFAWEAPTHARGRSDRFQVFHDAVKIIKYAL